MPQLRRHRRDHRARAPKKRRRRNLKEFVPRADRDFAFTSNGFANSISMHPEKYGLTSDDAALIADAVMNFRMALADADRKLTANPQTIGRKKRARKRAEVIVRRYGNIIRANPQVSALDKKTLRINERPKKLKQRKCPKDPPELMFVGSGDGVAGGPDIAIGGGCGVHVLKFYQYISTDIRHAGTRRKGKPDGAVRIELFLDLIPPGEPVPKSPFDRMRRGSTSGGGWPWYLRSFTKSPIEVEFPLPSQPMLVVYWARWADATGEVSRFSKTCVARVEGWTQSLPAPPLPELSGSGAHALSLPGMVETKYVVLQMPREALPAADDDGEDEVAIRREPFMLPAVEARPVGRGGRAER